MRNDYEDSREGQSRLFGVCGHVSGPTDGPVKSEGIPPLLRQWQLVQSLADMFRDARMPKKQLQECLSTAFYLLKKENEQLTGPQNMAAGQRHPETNRTPEPAPHTIGDCGQKES